MRERGVFQEYEVEQSEGMSAFSATQYIYKNLDEIFRGMLPQNHADFAR